MFSFSFHHQNKCTKSLSSNLSIKYPIWSKSCIFWRRDKNKKDSLIFRHLCLKLCENLTVMRLLLEVSHWSAQRFSSWRLKGLLKDLAFLSESRNTKLGAGIYKIVTCSITSKNKTTNLLIHEFKVLHKVQSLLNPLFNCVLFLICCFKKNWVLLIHFKGFKRHFVAL